MNISNKNHVQHTTCHVCVTTHSPSKLWPGDMGPGLYDLSHAVINVSVDEGPMGSTAQLTLVPDRPYREIIFPGDWISIYFSINNVPPEDFRVLHWKYSVRDVDRVFLGIVDAVRQTTVVDANTGAMHVRISMSCTGIIKAFLATQIYYNEMLGPNTLFGAQVPGLSTLTKNIPLMGTPTTMVRAIALAYLGFGGQFLLPETWPEFNGTAAERKRRLDNFLEMAYDIEKMFGFTNVRLSEPGKPQRRGLVATLWERHRKKAMPNALATIMDFFTYVEDDFVDGRVHNTPTHDLSGSVWQLMVENSNPCMNEMYITLLPSELEEFQTDTDEWGFSPIYVPCLVLREYPFSTTDYYYKVPARDPGASRYIQFGNVFFSDRKSLALCTPLQVTEGDPSGRIAALRRKGRFVDRIQISPYYVIEETLGTSDNDLRNFWIISQIQSILTHQRYVLLKDGLIPVFLPESIKRYGLRLEDIQTKFLYTGGKATGNSAVFDFLVRCLLAQDMWKQHMPYYLAGTIKVPGMPKARRGMVLDIGSPRNESYYVEAVNHQWTHPGVMYTTFTVTRGQPSGFDDISKRFEYAPPDVIEIYAPDNIVEIYGADGMVDRYSTNKRRVSRVKAKEQPQVMRREVDPRDVQTIATMLGIDGNLVQQAQQRAQQKKTDILDELVLMGVVSADKVRSLKSKMQVKPRASHIEVKEDRLRAGKPPWIEQKGVVGAMYDVVRRIKKR